MKLWILAFSLITFLSASFGHSGRTDSKGGHYNRSTGVYHYHNSGSPKKTTKSQTPKATSYQASSYQAPRATTSTPKRDSTITFRGETITVANNSNRPESYYQNYGAVALGGQEEVTMGDGTRCDILTSTHAIEVDFEKKWAEAIGQSLNYSFQSGRRAGILLIVDTHADTRKAIRIVSLINHYDLPVDLWLIDKATKQVKEFALGR